MGLRSWLTPLSESGDWTFFKKAIHINPYSFGIHYVIEVTQEIPIIYKGIWVAWSGDCTSSLTKYMPGHFVDSTILVDNLLDCFPAWHEDPGPGQFGTFLAVGGRIEKRLSSLLEKTGKDNAEVGGKAVKVVKPAAGKAEKILAMFADGQWELARGILEKAQGEHLLFEELLEGGIVIKGKLTFSTLIKKAFPSDEIAKAELSMLEVLLHLPKDLKALQKLNKGLMIKLRADMLTKYWKEVGEYEFSPVEFDPKNLIDQWHKKRETEITMVEKKCKARGKALNKAWKEEENLGKGVKFEMLLIPAGKFKMGSPASEKSRQNNETQHEVTLTKPFYMGKYEVTQELWEAVMEKRQSKTIEASLPVTGISWKKCKEFIKNLNAKTDGGYRLPTEAEWEYACRAGTTTAYSFGYDITPKDANYEDSNIGRPLAVGSYMPNAFGLYDMHGNLWEWCEDWFGDYPAGTVIDPKGPATGKRRVLRGGSFDFQESLARSSFRGLITGAGHVCYYGFRLARTAL